MFVAMNLKELVVMKRPSLRRSERRRRTTAKSPLRLAALIRSSLLTIRVVKQQVVMMVLIGTAIKKPLLSLRRGIISIRVYGKKESVKWHPFLYVPDWKNG